MDEIIKKIKEAIADLEREKGALALCALFLRETPLEKWDIIISAQWLNSKSMNSYNLVASKLKTKLSVSELVKFSRIVLLQENDPLVSYLKDLETISNGGYKELNSLTLSEKFNFSIKKAYLLRS